MRHEEWAESDLAGRQQRGLLRTLRAWPEAGGKIRADGRTWLNFSSNDYLDLARRPEVVAAGAEAARAAGSGATASRLMAGTLSWHEELERRLAGFKNYPAALVFGSGYLTNVGAIPALVGRGDTIVADRLVHACIIDGAILSRANLRRFEHNEAGDLEKHLKSGSASGRRLVVTESVFSMDGDLAPLADIARLADEYEAMIMVDEAHATGVFGPEGRGLVNALGLESRVNVSMGTLSKALGGYGGFVACSAVLRELFVNRARSFIYSTALPPFAVGATLGALDVMEKEPDGGTRLLERAAAMREVLKREGLDTGHSASQIIPVMVGDNHKAVSLSARLRGDGILAPAIRPPTVPAGAARLRLSITLAHGVEHLTFAASAIAAAARAEGVI
jgi:8-amino-7-oxononanoate synthase